MHLAEQTATESCLWSFSDFNWPLKVLRWLTGDVRGKAQRDTTLPSAGLQAHTQPVRTTAARYRCWRGQILLIWVKKIPPSNTVPWVPTEPALCAQKARRTVREAEEDYFSQHRGDCLYSLQGRKWKLFQTSSNQGWKQLWHQLLYVQRFMAGFTAELTATSRGWLHPRISYFKRERDRLQTT